MLQLKIDDGELFDEKRLVFIPVKGQTLTLEHSLISISKWESKWKKPFLSKAEKTKEETIDYVRFMTITQNVNPLLYSLLTDSHIAEINHYIDDPMTATIFSKVEGKGRGYSKVITSEEIYYYMTAYNIPFKCETWHFNRLMTLIRVCDEKSKPKKKMSKNDYARKARSVNAARRAQYRSRG